MKEAQCVLLHRRDRERVVEEEREKREPTGMASFVRSIQKGL